MRKLRSSVASCSVSTLTLLVSLLSLSHLSSAYAERTGPGSTGGGNAVMTEDGVLQPIDSLTAESLAGIQINAWSAAQKIHQRVPFPIRWRSERDPVFFSDAKDLIEKSNLFTEDQKAVWLKLLEATIVTRVPVPVFESYKNQEISIATAIYLALNQHRLPLLPFAYSTKTDVHNQIPLARYQFMKIDIYDDFYSSMTANGKTTIQVHEAVRVYGDTLAKSPFTTNEVEALTQAIMGEKIQVGADYESALKKI